MRLLLILAATALLIYAVVVGGGGIPTQPPPSAPTPSITFTGRPGPTGTDICARLVQLHPDASCHVISQDGP